MTGARTRLRRRPQPAPGVWIALAAGLLVACAADVGPSPAARTGASGATALNDRLTDRGAAPGRTGEEAYRVGPDDVLDISVFQAEDFDRLVRVGPDGSISLPLVGRLQVSGLTTDELERTLAERLGAKYFRDPQVSVFVEEHRAHPVTVLGEVNRPGVYYLRRPRTLVEMLTEAGGLTEEAGAVLHLRRKASRGGGIDVAAAPEPKLVTIDLRELLESPDSGLGPTLRDHDSLYVPKAGRVFVEGAVEKPGAYPLHGAATVLRAVALAGGLEGTAKRSGVEVIRAGDPAAGTLRVDLDTARRDPASDLRIHDGDIVVVKSSVVKTALLGIYRGIVGLLHVSTGF